MSGQWYEAPPLPHTCEFPLAAEAPVEVRHLTRWRCPCGVLWWVVEPGSTQAMAATVKAGDGTLWQRVPRTHIQIQLDPPEQDPPPSQWRKMLGLG